jgi:hypothetical protein
MIGCAFTSALCRLDGAALITRRRERDWCSAGLCGKSVTVDLLWRGSEEDLCQFLAQLPDRDFDLPTSFVADISATRQGPVNEGEAVTIQALVLRDDV